MLVLRAENVPKKRSRVKDQFFVTVTDQATTKKTASVSIKGQTVQWNKRFDALYDICFLPYFPAENSVQFGAVVCTAYIPSLCEAIVTFGYAYWDARDVDTC